MFIDEVSTWSRADAKTQRFPFKKTNKLGPNFSLELIKPQRSVPALSRLAPPHVGFIAFAL